MDNFKAVDKILSQLEKAMDYPEMDLVFMILQHRTYHLKEGEI